jgi:hypothetical protein
MQKDSRALVKGSPGLGQDDAISAAIQQAEPQLAFQVFDGRKDGRLRPEKLFAGCLEAALGDDSFEAEELVERDSVHHDLYFL